MEERPCRRVGIIGFDRCNSLEKILILHMFREYSTQRRHVSVLRTVRGPRHPRIDYHNLDYNEQLPGSEIELGFDMVWFPDLVPVQRGGISMVR